MLTYASARGIRSLKVLIIACRYYPAKNSGGPVISIDNLCSLLNHKVEFHVLAFDHDVGSDEKFKDIDIGWNKRDNCSVYYLSKKDVNTNVVSSLIADLRPDLLYVNSLFSHMFVVSALKCARDRQLPVLLAPRGQLCKNAFKKKAKKLVYLTLYRRLFSKSNVFYQYTSMEERKAILDYLPVKSERVLGLPNIPNTRVNPPKKAHKVQGKLKIAFISRVHSKKNLLGAIKLLHEVSGDVRFDIYGPLEEKSYWQKCQDEISKLPRNISVAYLGSVNYDEVFNIFASHDVFLFPTLSENYGHVIAESLLSGCPVLISDQTPWSGVTDEGVGWAYSLDNQQGFSNTLNHLVKMDSSEYRAVSLKCRRYVLNQINLEEIAGSYYSSFEMLINRRNKL